MKSKYFTMFGMPIILLLLVSLIYMVGCSSPSGTDSGSSSSSTESSQNDTADGKELYENKCGSCHSLSLIEDSGYTGTQWAGVVKDMQSKTTTISDSDAEAITQYLESTYPD